MSAPEIIWTALALNALFWLLLLARFFYRREGLTIVLAVVFFLTAVFAASAAVKHYGVAYAPRGVVVAPEIQVRSGTSLNDTVLFRLHEAAEFVWGEERDGWVLISLCDGKKGWVQAGSIAKVD
jgi:SH3-like domain-containing protein